MNEIKTKWSEVTIGQYQELTSIQTDNEVTLFIERLSILTDRDPAEIRALGLREFQDFQKKLAFLSENVSAEVVLKFELDGVRYGMIPDLNFITTGEWADIDNWKDDTVGNIHLICALIYRPVKRYVDNEDYEIEPHRSQGFTKRADLFLNKLPITTVYGAVLFFSASGIQFIEIIADFLEEEAKLAQKTTKTTRTRKASKKNK